MNNVYPMVFCVEFGLNQFIVVLSTCQPCFLFSSQLAKALSLCSFLGDGFS